MAAPPIRPGAQDPALLAVLRESQDLGFLGPGDPARHVEHAGAFVPVVRGSDCVLDLGSGGGLPGLVLLRALPELEMVLVDAMERRCHFLERAVHELGAADRARVECGRAEELARRPDLRGLFPVVVARSFGAPAVTAECAAGFLADHGRLVVSEPPTSARDRWSAEGVAVLGLAPSERIRSDDATLQVLTRVAPLDDRYPRRNGVPAKRPLF